MAKSNRLKSILLESLIDINKPGGQLQIILDVNDHRYYELRAIELIKEAQSGNYHECIKVAITLLAISRMKV